MLNYEFVIRTFENLQEMANSLGWEVRQCRDYIKNGNLRQKRYKYEYVIINDWGD